MTAAVPAATAAPVPAQQAELATAADYDFAGFENLVDVWRSESDGDFTPEFPRVKAKGGIFDLGEEFAPVRAFAGIVVAWHKSSRLYLDAYGEGDDANKRPDAWSTDGKTQIVPQETLEKVARINQERAAAGRTDFLPVPHTDLATCPFNKFVGDPGVALLDGQTSGKANNEYRELYIVLPGAESVVPYQLSVPATSLKAWDGRGGYANGLITKGVKLASLETIFEATVEKSGSVEWTVFSFRRGRKLDESIKHLSITFGEGIREFVKHDPFAAARGAVASNLVAGPPVAQLAAPVQPQAALPAAPAAPAQPVVLDQGLDAAFASVQTTPAVPAQVAPAAAPAQPVPAAVAPAPVVEAAAVPAATAAPAQAAPAPVVEQPVQAAPVPVAEAPAAAAAPAPVEAAPQQAAPVVAEQAPAPAPAAAPAAAAPAAATPAPAAPVADPVPAAAPAAEGTDGIDF